MNDWDRALLKISKFAWLRWRGKLLLGKALKRIGSAILDTGWSMTDSAAVEASRLRQTAETDAEV